MPGARRGCAAGSAVPRGVGRSGPKRRPSRAGDDVARGRGSGSSRRARRRALRGAGGAARLARTLGGPQRGRGRLRQSSPSCMSGVQDGEPCRRPRSSRCALPPRRADPQHGGQAGFQRGAAGLQLREGRARRGAAPRGCAPRVRALRCGVGPPAPGLLLRGRVPQRGCVAAHAAPAAGSSQPHAQRRRITLTQRACGSVLQAARAAALRRCRRARGAVWSCVRVAGWRSRAQARTERSLSSRPRMSLPLRLRLRCLLHADAAAACCVGGTARWRAH